MRDTINKQELAFPRQANKVGGWTIDTAFLKKVESQIEQTDRDELPDSMPSWEQIELVLLAVEAISTSTEPAGAESAVEKENAELWQENERLLAVLWRHLQI